MIPPAATVAERTLVLDGGTGQELRRLGVAGADALWSARALLDAPEAVLGVHAAYLDAGADVLTTNTYSTSRRRLEDAGLGDRFAALNRRAGELATAARSRSGREAWIAGSLPPITPSYRPDLVQDDAALDAQYRDMVDVLAPFVDLWLCETMSLGREAAAAAAAAAESGLPVWVAFTLADGGADTLRSGESVAVAAAQVQERARPGAWLVNCCTPDSVSAAMGDLVALPGRAGGYANGFVGVPDGWSMADHGLPEARDDLTPDRYAAVAARWLADGATIVGGCCEVGPAHIAALRRLVDGA